MESVFVHSQSVRVLVGVRIPNSYKSRNSQAVTRVGVRVPNKHRDVAPKSVTVPRQAGRERGRQGRQQANRREPGGSKAAAQVLSQGKGLKTSLETPRIKRLRRSDKSVFELK